MHAKPDLRVFLKWMIAGSGSVITDVITLKRLPCGLLIQPAIELPMKQNPYEPPQHTSGPPRQSTAGMVWVEVDRRWVDRVRSPMFMVVAAFTGVSISFAPLTLLFLDHIPVPSVYRWIIAGICLTMIYVIPGWYMRLAGEVLRQLHAKRT